MGYKLSCSGIPAGHTGCFMKRNDASEETCIMKKERKSIAYMFMFLLGLLAWSECNQYLRFPDPTFFAVR